MAVLKSGVAKVLNAEEKIMEQLLRKFSGMIWSMACTAVYDCANECVWNY
jgi:hypothetical protein